MGGSDDFDAFYNATSRRLLHQIYAMTGNLADAQDCMQEAFARAWQHWQQVRRADDPAAWVRTAPETGFTFQYGVVVGGSVVSFVMVCVDGAEPDAVVGLLGRAGVLLGQLD